MEKKKKLTTCFSAIDEVPTRRITLKRVVAPAKKTVKWMQLKKLLRNPLRKESNLFDEKTNDSNGAEVPQWKSRCSIAAVLMGVVLAVYVVFIIWASQKSTDNVSIRTIVEGSCSTVNATNFGLHVLINVLGMAVSIASACALYFLSSPTRNEIDEAHAKGNSFDIGVLSFRNLKSFKKKVLFGLLIISSLPIHFLSVYACMIPLSKARC